MSERINISAQPLPQEREPNEREDSPVDRRVPWPFRPIDKCVQCGRPESDHHEFDPGERPAGCVCDHSSWGKHRLPAICGAFVTDGREDNYCRTCHHDEECHTLAEIEP